MLAERVAHHGGVGAEAVAEAVDEAGDGVDRQRRLVQIGRRGAEMDRRQLVEAHRVVGDDDLGGHLRQPPTCFLEDVASFVELRICVRTSGFVRFSHSQLVLYRSDNQAKWGASSHPAICMMRPGRRHDEVVRIGGAALAMERPRWICDFVRHADPTGRTPIARR